jgi:hypothetical protein
VMVGETNNGVVVFIIVPVSGGEKEQIHHYTVCMTGGWTGGVIHLHLDVPYHTMHLLVQYE